MTDVIHKVLNDITVDDWDVIIGGDSHPNVEGRRLWCRFRNCGTAWQRVKPPCRSLNRLKWSSKAL